MKNFHKKLNNLLSFSDNSIFLIQINKDESSDTKILKYLNLKKNFLRFFIIIQSNQKDLKH